MRKTQVWAAMTWADCYFFLTDGSRISVRALSASVFSGTLQVWESDPSFLF